MNKNTKKLTVVTGAALATVAGVAVNAQNVHADAQVAAKSNATVEESPVQKQHEQALQNVNNAENDVKNTTPEGF